MTADAIAVSSQSSFRFTRLGLTASLIVGPDIGRLDALSETAISTSLEGARRLAVTKQHLAGKPPARSTGDAILSVIRDLCYVQWDPVSVVAPAHVIALWSRFGDFRPSVLDQMLWEERRLFQYWAHAASIVLTEDYPIYHSLMRRYPESLSKSWGSWKVRARKFLAENKELRRRVLRELSGGPLQLSQFEDHGRTKTQVDGWSSGSAVSAMLFHLQMSGEVMVVGHEGNRNVWGLSDEFLPSWVGKEELSEEEVERRSAERAIRALGTASPSEINFYFPRGFYQDLKGALEHLERESTIQRVHVEGLEGKGSRYVHDEDVSLLESVTTKAWEPRMSLLAPFDNLLCVSKKMFGFEYVHEIFLPKYKRRFGTYVLPILWGDRFIGRVDPQMDRENEKLLIHSVHAESGAPKDRQLASRIREKIEQLGQVLGAKEVAYSTRVPAAWRSALR